MSDFENLNFEDAEAKIVDTLKETDRKCPSCAGVMDFDPNTGGLSCPFCGHTEEIQPMQQTTSSAEELDFNVAQNIENCDWGMETKTVLCKSCGAETIYDVLQTSAACPFCGSNQVMQANTEQTIAPGGIIPFKITDKEAAEHFHKWIRKKWFCPKLAKESAKPTSFKGIYLPYWTFDTNTLSEYMAKYGIDHTTTGKDGKTHTVTNWHSTSGMYHEFFDDELVLASKNHDAYMLQGVEPFSTAKNISYKPEYVAGFLSERYSIGLKDAWEIAKNAISGKLRNNITNKIRVEKHADHVKELRITPVFSDIKYKYLLLPIWVSNFKYNDKVYQFMVNGETGKVSGKTPISIAKVILTIFIALVVLGGIYYLSN